MRWVTLLFAAAVRERRAEEEKLWTNPGGNAPHVVADPPQKAQMADRAPRPKTPPKVGPPEARLTVTPGHVRGGKRVTIRGQHFGHGRHGCEPCG